MTVEIPKKQLQAYHKRKLTINFSQQWTYGFTEYFTRFHKPIGSLSMQRFWATDGHRKCTVFLIYLSSYYHIYILKFLCASRDLSTFQLGTLYPHGINERLSFH